MEQFSIKQVSTRLKISKDALRYYDKLGLVCPTRGDNNYRYYTAQDMSDLQYIQVLTFTGFSLSEISHLFQLMRACDITNFPLMLQVLKSKREDLARRVAVFQSMINYIDEAEETMHSKASMADMAKIDALVAKMFSELTKMKGEMK